VYCRDACCLLCTPQQASGGRPLSQVTLCCCCWVGSGRRRGGVRLGVVYCLPLSALPVPTRPLVPGVQGDVAVAPTQSQTKINLIREWLILIKALVAMYKWLESASRSAARRITAPSRQGGGCGECVRVHWYTMGKQSAHHSSCFSVPCAAPCSPISAIICCTRVQGRELILLCRQNLKAVYHIIVSSAENGRFQPGFDFQHPTFGSFKSIPIS